MKAAQQTRYSKKELALELVEREKPTLKKNQVLVRIKAAGVNPLDYKLIEGEVRPLFSYSMPFVAGNEFSGVVEAVGTQVDNFKVGERVYARLPILEPGAFTEYVAIEAKNLAHVPDYMSFEEAATVPLTALTAYQALELLQVEAGKTLFISGGTGGFGAMAIPLAKARGLKVITSGSRKNRERVLALGADQFIDYKTEDYSQVLSDVDYVIDSIGGKELSKQFGILKKGGALVTLNGMPNKAFAKRMGFGVLKTLILSLAGRKYDKLAAKNQQSYHFLFVEANGEQLEAISKIFAQDKIPLEIDSRFELSEVNQALAKVKKGGVKGKVIVTMGEEK